MVAGRFRPTIAFALGCATVVAASAIVALAVLLGKEGASEIGSVATAFIVGATAVSKDIVGSDT